MINKAPSRNTAARDSRGTAQEAPAQFNLPPAGDSTMHITKHMPVLSMSILRGKLNDEPPIDGIQFWSPNGGVTKYTSEGATLPITVRKTCQKRFANAPTMYVQQSAIIDTDGTIHGHEEVIRDVFITFYLNAPSV